ncbi:MAG: rhodanese-related sulfurtransferase [Pyrinomonadaceae bacterium]
MENQEQTQIIAFYEFKDMPRVGPLEQIKAALKAALIEFDVRGTIIIATEGYNGMVCGTENNIFRFIPRIEDCLATKLVFKSSFHLTPPFRKVDVKIKPEIVTLKQSVDISMGNGTHIAAENWNKLISDPETFILDARNDYEFQSGTFRGAINPTITKFSELPRFVAENLDPAKHKRIAMFCTGGIRCEKFAPYMKGLGFEEVYQLEGGILKYLEEIPVEELLWEGECFVFDERTTVDSSLKKGHGHDLSQRHAHAKKQAYKVAK